MDTFNKFLSDSNALTLSEALTPNFFLPADIKAALNSVKSLNINDVMFDNKKSTSKRHVFILRSADRETTKNEVHAALRKSNISFADTRVTGSSFNSTVIDNVILMYKPKSGGMGESTINSTITELAPALAFNAGKNFGTKETFYSWLTTLNHNTVSKTYVNDADKAAGINFVELFPTSSKFDEKMKNALGILKYLISLNDETPISKVVWAYRAKPRGVPSNFKGDLIIYFTNGKMLGVSLKAGGAKTKEPQLNTYVQPILKNLKLPTVISNLRNELYTKVYSKLDLPKDYDARNKRKSTYDTLEKFEKENSREYERLYDISLEIQRKTIIDALNKNKDGTLTNFIYGQVLNKIPGIPLVIIKAIGANYTQVTDEDDLETFLPRVDKIKAYSSQSSKQDFFMDLISDNETLTMLFSIRTSQSGVGHKLGQFSNLRVIFKGLK